MVVSAARRCPPPTTATQPMTPASAPTTATTQPTTQPMTDVIREVPGSERCYSGAVARSSNPAAHGCIQVTEERPDGWRRLVNINQIHREEGPWWNYPAEIRAISASREEVRAADDAAAAYAWRIRPRTPGMLSLATQYDGGMYLALIRGAAVADEIVIGGGRSRAAALRDGARNADRIIAAISPPAPSTQHPAPNP